MPQIEEKVRPARFTPAELKKVNVEVGEGWPYSTALWCLACGIFWAPMLQRGGRLPRGYWKCPKGCNH